MPQTAHQRSKLTSLKAQRIAAGLSISDLAKKAGLSDWAIVNAESNGAAVTSMDAAKVAAALGVSLATLGQVEL
jgi:DNA-binding XRE family transcriptional regulator